MPQQQGRGEVLAESMVGHFGELTIMDHGSRQGRRKGALERPTMDPIPKHLVKNALVKRCIGRIHAEVTMNQQTEDNHPKGDRPYYNATTQAPLTDVQVF